MAESLETGEHSEEGGTEVSDTQEASVTTDTGNTWSLTAFCDVTAVLAYYLVVFYTVYLVCS